MKQLSMICLALIIAVLTSCNNPSIDKGSTPDTTSIPVQTEKEKSSLDYSEAIGGIVQIKKTTGDSIKYGFADSNKNIIAEPVYDDSRFYIGASSASAGFSEGLAPVKKNDKWGYIDLKGNVIIDFSYDDALCFSEGLALVKLNGKLGYINNKGEVVIDYTYEYAYDFLSGVAAVKETDSKFGFINTDGAWVVKPEYDAIDLGTGDYNWTKNNIVKIQQGDLWGVAKIRDGNVEIVVKPKYNKIYPYKDNKAQFVLIHKDKDGNYTTTRTEGYIDEFGVEIEKRELTD